MNLGVFCLFVLDEHSTYCMHSVQRGTTQCEVSTARTDFNLNKQRLIEEYGC